MLPSLTLLVLLLAPGAAALAPPAVPPWLGRCLPQLRPSALEQGASMPTDSGKSAEYGTCAARCEERCFLTGDFDGNGKPDLAVASPGELLVFHDLQRGRNRRYSATPLGRLPLSGDEVALLSLRRTQRFADEVGLLRDGKSPLPPLPRNERLAFGLIVWHGAAQDDAADDEDSDDHGQSSESGDLLVAIFDEVAHTYRLQRVLQLGGGAGGP